jgi:uncharacterized protein YjiS (DUF1127 family)
MAHAARTLATPWKGPLSRRKNLLSNLFHAIELAIAVRRERSELQGLSDHVLKDLGLSRADAFGEATRSLWDIPADRRPR